MKFLNINLDQGNPAIPSGSGNMSSIVANGGDIAQLRTNATLRKDEWKSLDTAVVRVARKPLRVVAALRRRGLTYNLGDPLGTTVLEWESRSEMNDAEVDMMGKTRGDNDAVEFDINYLPIPIVHKAFEINARKLRASRKMGQALDTDQAEESTFKVSEMIEKMTIVGTGGPTYGGGTVYGIENEPNVNTGSLTSAWTNDSARDPLTDVQAMIQALVDLNMYGPFMLIVPSAYNRCLGDDYVATTSTTITVRERLQKLEGLDEIIVSHHATSSKVSLVNLRPQTIRMVLGQDPAPVEWSSGDKMTMYFKVMAITVPQVRADQDGNSGVVVYSE